MPDRAFRHDPANRQWFFALLDGSILLIDQRAETDRFIIEHRNDLTGEILWVCEDDFVDLESARRIGIAYAVGADLIKDIPCAYCGHRYIWPCDAERAEACGNNVSMTTPGDVGRTPEAEWEHIKRELGL